MNSCSQVMKELKSLGTERNRKTFARHGATKNFYGVSIADLKTIAKKIKGNQALACELYETGNIDAMYLAGIVADGSQMNKKQLDAWARQADWQMISEYSVPFVAHEHPDAHTIARKWIKSKKEHVAAAGWNTYSGVLATRTDEEIDLDEVKELLDLIDDSLHESSNRVKYTMNGFMIAVGAYVKPLAKEAKRVAKSVGKVRVDMGDTSCKVPDAIPYIEKIEKGGRQGKKRKTIKC